MLWKYPSGYFEEKGFEKAKRERAGWASLEAATLPVEKMLMWTVLIGDLVRGRQIWVYLEVKLAGCSDGLNVGVRGREQTYRRHLGAWSEKLGGW